MIDAMIQLELSSPITEDQWDMIQDVDFEYTNEIWFNTKHGKIVTFLKATNDVISRAEALERIRMIPADLGRRELNDAAEAIEKQPSVLETIRKGEG